VCSRAQQIHNYTVEVIPTLLSQHSPRGKGPNFPRGLTSLRETTTQAGLRLQVAGMGSAICVPIRPDSVQELGSTQSKLETHAD
jgi:hypothetical protein